MERAFFEGLERQRKREAGRDVGGRSRRLAAQVALDRAAVHVVELDASEWCQWVGYLLEVIESLGMERGVHKLDMDAFMGQVAEMVMVRASSGGW